MNRHTFIWGIPRYQVKSKEHWLEFCYFISLWVGAIILYTINLGELALRDWDEGTFAQVAKEIYQASFQDWHWLFPTMWDQPYFNKPPLIHSLTALAYSVLGINEFSTRIVGASLTALSVPLLYLLAKELFLPRYYALFSALVYLTTIPVVRHGRLAMLDGGVLCFYILLLLCILKARRDLRWTYPAGISLALICLCKGWMMGVLLGAIAFLFIIWDTPRLISSVYTWCGILLGIMPVISWYSAQYIYYGERFIDANIKQQSLERVFTVVEGHQGPIWFYLLELLKYPHPWIFFAIWGLKLAWENRNWSWAKFILVSSLTYLIAVSVMGTKLPWYIMPIYPALSISAGVALAQIKSIPSFESYPRLWIRFFTLLTITMVGGLSYFIITEPHNQNLLTVIGVLVITFLTVTILLQKKDQQFIDILFWGMYVALIVFLSSNYWLWELNEAYAVKPIANVVQKSVSWEENVYIDFDYDRPSLDFYSDRRIIAIDQEKLKKLLTTSSSYLLVKENTLSQLNFVSQNGNYCYSPIKSNQLISSDMPKQNCFNKIVILESEFSLLEPIK